ncbi:acyl-CoA N-acyltransferase [Phaeosphaeriaceae sp. PMI808]|nr:acyl-CoA N-acyltransferase [Phaeosphaeriaceae sp. PMI808]
MASTTPKNAVRSAKNVEEAKSFWWPLMQELGWNRAVDDAKTHFEVAHNGKNWLFIVPESTNTPQGMVIPFIYPNSTGWVAFFIMNAAFRGKGLGRELWKEMQLKFSDAGTTIIGLDGVEEQVETYRRRGFEDYARIPLMTRESLQDRPIDVTWSDESAVELEDLRDVDPKLLAKLDLEHTGLDRSAYWATGILTSRPHAFGFAISNDGELTGFIYARRCQEGVRIGPLYAATYAQALQLLHKLMNDFQKSEGTFIAEVFGSNAEGRKVFEELGWNYAGISYHRMWLHKNVPVEQQPGGKGTKGMFAIFDACAG